MGHKAWRRYHVQDVEHKMVVMLIALNYVAYISSQRVRAFSRE